MRTISEYIEEANCFANALGPLTSIARLTWNERARTDNGICEQQKSYLLTIRIPSARYRGTYARRVQNDVGMNNESTQTSPHTR
jgi:hypothetical protein